VIAHPYEPYHNNETLDSLAEIYVKAADEPDGKMRSKTPYHPGLAAVLDLTNGPSSGLSGIHEATNIPIGEQATKHRVAGFSIVLAH
jgi:hypothetical protein